jgi:MFS family permease
MVLLGAFLVTETRVSNPVIPLGVFRRRSLSAANAGATVIGPIVFGTYFFVSLYLQQIERYSPLRTGLAFLPVALGTLAGALLASRIVRRVGTRASLQVAPLLIAGGLVWLSQLSPGASYLGSLLIPLALVGSGVGLTFVPSTLAATAGMPHNQAGLASGLTNTSRTVGGAVGLAALVTIARTAAKHAEHTHSLASALTHGYDRAFLVMAGMALVAAGTASLPPRIRRPSEQADDAVLAEVIAEGAV